ncbi:hypothetical protein GCM10011380_13370 [Sphingomonas metalli]|jgi:hypothetical protein|uniref:Uncharacterized protein n=1 Tax=Sphingomonas metalli TaxID=1779358 RepID=A0A916SZX3_9SPHN|nr:hypothetical protein [Sphingomonas metalli]GGB25115.1 hypothetical protein GCM10011380_13370 [Sphingomonas metalli]
MVRTLAMMAVMAAAVPATAQQQAAALPGAEKPRPVQQQAGVGKGAPVNGVLILYGNERCPTNSDGEEIVICERRNADEQFRVPKELRNLEITPENRSWAARAQETLDVGTGVNGTGSCSPVGAGGATGCFGQAARTNRAVNKARKEEEARAPQ